MRWPDARRFESSNFHRPSIVGMARSIGWLSMFVGLDWVYERGPALARLAADRLAAIDGVELVTPRDQMATLVTFRIAGWPAEAALDELGARVFAIARTVPLLDALRISVGLLHVRGGARAVRRGGRAAGRPHAGDAAAAPAADDPGRGMTAPRDAAGGRRPAGGRCGPAAVVGARSAGASSATRRGRSSGRCCRASSWPSSWRSSYLAYDVALSRGVDLPGGDLRVLAVAAYVVLVLVVGSVVTYLVVPQPTGSGTVRRRSGWSAALGFFAAVPIAWLVMVAATQIVRPLLG